MLIWATLGAYFAFTDLPISISVVNQNSGWAIFLEKFGEIPGLLVLFCGAHTCLARHSPESRFKKIILSIILFLAASFISGYLIFVVYKGITDKVIFLQDYRIVIIITLLILNYLLHALIKNLKIPNLLLQFSKMSVMLGVFGYLFLIQPIKLLWGRVRFRDLDAFYSNFTSWFLPNGINGNQSFPSGHAAMAWMILPLLLLVVNKNKGVKISLSILSICWGIVVSLSRVVVGAHYASDALFGSSIIIVVFLVITHSYWETFKKY